MSALIDQLIQQGVRDFAVAPGSRSSPLVAALPFEPLLHYDERGLAFWALGRARATHRPVALIVTSGTAVGNLLPAVMEAHHAEIPLLLLTADRPCELRECGANQATRQTSIFAPFVRWQFELDPAIPEAALRSYAAHAVALAATGPVHLNCPFRNTSSQPPSHGQPLPHNRPQERPLTLTLPPTRGAIFLGSSPSFPDVAGVHALAAALNWPLITRDLLPLKPDLLLHFGGRSLFPLPPIPTLYFHSTPTRYDQHRASATYQTSLAPQILGGSAPPDWLPAWNNALTNLQSQIDSLLSTPAFTEPHLARHIPLAPLFVGNSLPIRDLTRFGPLIPLHANRGLSGIDGNIATAAGLNLPAYLGDQTSLHDLNSLPLLTQPLFIVNNNGGRIFETLPHIPSPSPRWTNPHPYTFEHAARLFNLPYRRIESLQEMPPDWPTGPCLFEACPDPQLSQAIRKELGHVLSQTRLLI